jgi:D-alanyl-D-alanine carboxypeptidase (penicillin-binding protein 5/6)
VRLYEWGFENFEHRVLVKKGSEQGVVRVENARAGKDAVVKVKAKKSLKAIVRKDAGEDEIKTTLILPEQIPAPVQEGDKLGTLTLELDGRNLGTTDLLAESDVEARPRILDRLDEITHKPRTASPLGIVLALVVIVLGFFFVQAMRRRAWRKRHNRQRKKNVKKSYKKKSK